MLSSFYHMAGTEQFHVSKGVYHIGSTRGFFHQRLATLYILQALTSKIGLVISHERVEALVFFRRPSVSELKKVRGRGPFLKGRGYSLVLQNCGAFLKWWLSIPSEVGNLEYAMSLQPKNVALLQRRLAEAKDWHFWVRLSRTFQVFWWVLWPEHQELLYIIELNTTEVDRWRSVKLSCYMSSCILDILDGIADITLMSQHRNHA